MIVACRFKILNIVSSLNLYLVHFFLIITCFKLYIFVMMYIENKLNRWFLYLGLFNLHLINNLCWEIEKEK